jgi:P-type E1-E2 ATPase
MLGFYGTDFVICPFPANALRQGLIKSIGRYIPSSELVPGDVYEISDPNLSQFPSDGLLLSGDCIVNESMLTG